MHGAALSGIDAAKSLLGGECVSDAVDDECELPVVVIGAGAAGLFAASTALHLHESTSDTTVSKDTTGRRARRVVVLEATERHGGRVHTVTLPHHTSTNTAVDESSPQSHSDTDTLTRTHIHTEDTECSSVRVDLGASWLQQFPDNFLAEKAEKLGLKLHPTDFQSALCAASDGVPTTDLHTVVEELCDVALEQVANMGSSIECKCESSKCSECSSAIRDMSIVDALLPYISSLPHSHKREAMLALCGDINSDFGYSLHNTSARHSLLELGIGNNDHYIQQGYNALLDPVASELDIRYNTPVSVVDWSNSECVSVVTASGEVIRASHCICTVPVSVLKDPNTLKFVPQLPHSHMRALTHIHQGKCEKVVLRFSTRWWPHSTNGMYRWYDNAPHSNSSSGDLPILDWNEWLDMTECVGAPVVVGFCVGEEACAAHHSKSKSDAEIVQDALRAFQCWAWHRTQVSE